MEMRWLSVFIVLGLPLSEAWSAPVSDDKAREWYESGKEFYQEGKYSEALVAFETAYRFSERPTLLRSIGYCYEKLDRLEEALDTYYLWKSLAVPDRLPEIERHIRRIEETLNSQSVDYGGPAGRQIATVDPVPSRVSSPEPAEPPLKQPSPRVPPPQSPPRQEWRVSTGPVVLYGVSSAAAVASVVFVLQADRARKEALVNCSTGDAVFCRDSAASAIRRDRTFSVLTDVGLGLTGASLVGATLWMVADNRRTNLQVSPSLNGMHLLGRF